MFQSISEKRRSVYALTRDLPVPAAEVSGIVEHALLHTPSSFNSQSTRVIVLFNAEHEKLWNITEDCLRAVVPADQFAASAQKMAMFRAAAGSVLFFEDQETVRGLQAQFPVYADNFPVWAEHANAMHQYAIWCALAEKGVGANLQHYNPLIDDAVRQTWQAPASWTLRAQLVFGGIAQPAGEKSFAPLQGRMKVFGL